MKLKQTIIAILALATLLGNTTMAMAQSAYLEITLKVEPKNRAAAAAVYTQYKQPFLTQVPGAISKQLLVREDDVQVLHGFKTTRDAQDYLASDLFKSDVVGALAPLLVAGPEIRIYTAD